MAPGLTSRGPAVVLCSVLIVMDHGRPSGIAFVEFPTPQEATQVGGAGVRVPAVWTLLPVFLFGH